MNVWVQSRVFFSNDTAVADHGGLLPLSPPFTESMGSIQNQ